MIRRAKRPEPARTAYRRCRSAIISRSSGDAPFIQSAFPEVKIVAAEHAADVFRKESAREKMLALDDALAGFRGIPKAERKIFAGLHADLVVRDGDLIRLGETSARVIEAPGHTRDSICFFFEKEGFLISTETLGLLQREGSVHVPMLLGSELTLASLKKVMNLPVKTMLLPHAVGVIRGEAECLAFFEDARKSVLETREKVFDAIRNGKHGAKLEEVIRADSESGCTFITHHTLSGKNLTGSNFRMTGGLYL